MPFRRDKKLYVQRVLENTQVYRSRLTGSTIAGRLSADIEIGGNRNRAGKLPARTASASLPAVPARTLLIANAAQLVAPGALATETQPQGSTITAPPSAPPAGEDNSSPAAAEPVINSEVVSALPDNPGREDSVEPQKQLASSASPPSLNKHLKRAKKAPASASSSRPAAQAGTPTPERVVAADDQSAAALNAASKITLMPEKAAPSTLAEINTENLPGTSSDTEKPCQTYRAYIAATEKEEASAADLNAGMLAELQSGEEQCEPEKTVPSSTVD